MDISIILPVSDENDDTLVRVVNAYVEWLDASGHTWEILVVRDALGQMPGSRKAKLARMANVRICPPANGWGAAITAGFRASSGRLLCYTNWQRTSANALSKMLDFALRNHDVVLRANRRTRDTWVDRAGSLLYNMECRVLLRVPTWDINGTPKIFPRRFARLLDLTQTDNLLDAEFTSVCERAGYPVLEVPIEAPLHAGVSGGVDFCDATRMYVGVFKLRARLSRRG